MDVRLVIKSGSSKQRVMKLKCEETIVGRRPDCDLRIPSNDVSRRHCLLSIHDGCLNVEDLDSVNGTFLNGRKITGRQIVMPGDLLQIGPICFVAEYEMNQATRANLELEAGSDTSEEEESKPIPLAGSHSGKVDQTPASSKDESLDVLPLVDDGEEEATRLMPPPDVEAETNEEAIPMAAEFLDESEWHAPSDGDLRDLLSKLDDDAKEPKKK